MLILHIFGAARSGAEDVQVVVSGKYSGEVYTYKIGERRYLNAKQAIEAYGGRFYWYPVAGRVQLSVRSRQSQLVVDSRKARIMDRTLELPEPPLVRANTVFVPIEFFLSDAFAEMTGSSTQFNAQTRLLSIDQRSSVGPMRWFTYKDHTRVVLEMDPKLGYSLARKGRAAIDVTVPFGTIDWSENPEIADGVVDRVELRQESKLARLMIHLSEAAQPVWDTQVLSNPQRLVIDVYPDQEALDKAKAARRPLGETTAPPQRFAPQPAVESFPVAAAAGPAPAASGAAAAAGASAAAARPAPGPVKRRIVIDPGHGGKDSGAVGRRGTLEKALNLQASLELARLLREEGVFDVMLTREEDVFVPLAERSRMANVFGADLFVSIHCNASSRKAENGFEIYFLSERASDPEAERVAEMENASLALEDGSRGEDPEAALLLHAMAKTEFINDAAILAGLMTRALGKRVSLADRGVKQAAFYVLRGTNAPAVLVEMGFVSNPSEEAKLESKKFRRRMVEGVYAGLLEFAKRQEWMAAR
ncbi:MAG: N-acetylmuramoyl-L-alanine amidase [Elusimicrobia bacterium]|nr:N-acetylmuramoyl-L-alanine amidase [Elusimicrobiota bacterium]